MNRRGVLKGLGLVAMCAPAVIRTPGLLMPVRSITPYSMVATRSQGFVRFTPALELWVGDERRTALLMARPYNHSVFEQ